MSASLNTSIVSLVLSSGIIAKFVLGILAICSVLSWAIIFSKMVSLRRVEKENRRFLSVFLNSDSLRDVKSAVIHPNEGPVFSISKGLIEKVDPYIDWDKEIVRANSGFPPLSGLERSLRSGIQDEMNHYEKSVHFLATIGNTAPFIGLFGTVWGIMNSFRAIGLQESANIAVVAPGIAEALVATAAGLAAAIPAVVAYNFFVNTLRRLEIQLEIFSSELVTLVEEIYHRS
jgi:biopolymer transport protein TolQ